MRADLTDWIICGVKSDVYPREAEVFAATYEPVRRVSPANAACFEFETARTCRPQRPHDRRAVHFRAYRSTLRSSRLRQLPCWLAPSHS
jgi:hypothetical protein